VGVTLDITERKAAEAALRESEAGLKRAQEIAHLGSWELDLVANRLAWSDEVYRIFGLSPQEFGATYEAFLERVHPDDRAAVDAAYSCSVRDGLDSYEIEHRVVRKDSGEVRHVQEKCQHVRDAHGRIMLSLGMVLDITERKRAEEALRRSEARWNAAIDSFAEGAIIATVDEQVIYWNPAARAMHGFTRPDEGIEPLEKTPITFQLWTPDGSRMLDLDEWPMRRIKRGESVRNLELRICRPDQSWEKVFSYSGDMVDTAGGERLIFLTCHDLTELRKAEQARRESDQRFRLALRNAPVSVAAQDRDLRYIWAYNQRTARPGEIIGKLDSEIFTPEESVRITEIKRRVLEEGVDLREQMWLDRPDGRIFLDICWEPVRDEAGNVTGVASATVDLTPIKQAEEALKTSLQEKEVLLKEIHHRVKNNMQVISSLMDLQADQLENAATRAILQDVTQRVRSMALVHEKLYQSTDMARIDFSEYTGSLLNYLWRAHGGAASGIRLVFESEPVPLSINAAIPCGLILNELATNALKHAFRGREKGEVRVSLHGDAEGEVRIVVRDNGTGLPPDFDLRQAKSLGLSLVQILVKQLSARLEISSGEGTEFSIRMRNL
jgi:PAS domain S-box-containing protein